MKMKKKVAGILAFLMITLSIAGFSYALWSDPILITGTASTNTFIVGIKSGSNSTGDCETTGPLTLSDDELFWAFAKEYGPGTVDKITDISGPGVKFDFSGLQTGSGTTVGDQFAVNASAGGAYKTYGSTSPFSTYGDFSMYRAYRLRFYNNGTNNAMVNLKMNTGWTTIPPEYADSTRDTFWQSTWSDWFGPGESRVVTLYFCSAEVYNAGDEEVFTAYPDGTPDVCMWRTDEVSDIGFQVLGDGDGTGSIVVSAVDYVPKDIGDCGVLLTDQDSQDTSIYHGASWNIGSAYPSYHQFLKFNITNAGTVPAKITNVTIYDDVGTLVWNSSTSSLEEGGVPIINVCMWKYDINVGNTGDYQIPLLDNQIDPGKTEIVWIWIHFKQPILEGVTYNFKIYIEAAQWNE